MRRVREMERTRRGKTAPIKGERVRKRKMREEEGRGTIGGEEHEGKKKKKKTRKERRGREVRRRGEVRSRDGWKKREENGGKSQHK